MSSGVKGLFQGDGAAFGGLEAEDGNEEAADGLGSKVSREGDHGRTRGWRHKQRPSGSCLVVSCLHTTECKEVFYCYILNNSKRLEIISMFHQ